MATPSDLVAPRPAPPWRQKLAAFWRWWTDELVQLVPERWSVRGARVPLVAVEGDELVLVEPRAAIGPHSRIDLAALDETRRRAALRALLERAGEMRSRVRLCLGHDQALVRRVTMPLATEENLRQVLGFEMDRLTPFRADDVYFDYRVVSRDAANAQLHCQLAVARRDVVDATVGKLRGWGANVQGVLVRDDAGSHGAPLDLLPSEQRGEGESARERMVQRALIGAVVVLLLLALAIPLWQKRATVVALQPLLGNARQQAEATDAIARELERQVADYNFLLAKKHANPPALAYIEEMTRLLPDNTWVQQLDVKTVGKVREVTITGETPSSSKLIEILEQSKLLHNATTRGAVTRGSSPNLERFMIVTEGRPNPLPEATAVAPGPAPAPAKPGAEPQPAPAPPAAQPPKAALQPTKPAETRPAAPAGSAKSR